MSSSDDLDDIKAGLDCLRKAVHSIQTAQQASTRTGESRDKREVAIALTHAAEMAAVAERLFSSAVGEESREAREIIGDPRDWAKEESEQEGE